MDSDGDTVSDTDDEDMDGDDSDNSDGMPSIWGGASFFDTVLKDHGKAVPKVKKPEPVVGE